LSPVTGDLLSASSLLAALLGLLYSVWYPEINEATKTAIPDHDGTALVEATKLTLSSRAIPLVVVAGILTLVLAQPAVLVVVRSYQHRGSNYDAVQACFVAVFAVIVTLLVTIGMGAYRLYRHLRELRAVPG
jgi:hypothetical protein